MKARHYPLVFLSFLLPAGLEAAPLAGADLVDFRDVIREAKQRVFPAVVYVKCLRESLEEGRRATAEATGSGAVISADGLVLSNWHVVDKALQVRCLLSDGRAYDATVLGTDKMTDLALLQLHLPEGDAPVPYATMGDSTQLTEGDFVMAMGAPWGLNRSVSIGIISCSDRYLPQQSEYSHWLQTDASISPGNSGGPLVNTNGELIGINTLAIRQGGDIGFAVPSETVASLLPRLQQHGEVQWTWTGLQLQPLRDFNRNIYFEADEGIIVAETAPGSPAREAGILSGDRILAINGVACTALTSEDLPAVRRMIGLLPHDEPIRIELVRRGEPLAIDLNPREKGQVEGDLVAFPRWDMTVKGINQFDTPDLFFHRREGVFLYGIRRPGNAIAAGFAPRDIIVEVDGQSVTTIEEIDQIYREAMNRIGDQSRVRFTVLRHGIMRQIVLDFSRDFER